jgi:hypothetical protein
MLHLSAISIASTEGISVLKKEFTFKDLDGNEVTETYYFNLSTADLTKMALTHQGDIVQDLQAVVDSKNGAKIIEVFENIIRMSVGIRSDDGRSFVKTPEITAAFMNSEAYGQLFLELVTKADVAAEFVVGVMPGDLAEKAAALQAAGLPKMIDAELPSEERQPLTFHAFTAAELEAMNMHDLTLLYEGKLYDHPKYLRGFKPEDFSNNELLHMSDEEFDRIVGTDSKKWERRILVIAMQRKTQKR